MVPKWTRLKTFFGNQLFAAAFFGMAIVLRAPDAIAGLVLETEVARFRAYEFCIGSWCVGGPKLVAAATTTFLAAGATFFIGGLLYSIAVPGVIAGYPNRGDFVKASKDDGDVKVPEKRQEWEQCNRENVLMRTVVTVIILGFLVFFALFAASLLRIAVYALVGH